MGASLWCSVFHPGQQGLVFVSMTPDPISPPLWRGQSFKDFHHPVAKGLTRTVASLSQCPRGPRGRKHKALLSWMLKPSTITGAPFYIFKPLFLCTPLEGNLEYCTLKSLTECSWGHLMGVYAPTP